MRSAILATLFFVAACNPVDVVQPSYRDSASPITSTSRFDATKFSGTWQVVESSQLLGFNKPLPCSTSFYFVQEERGYTLFCYKPLPDFGNPSNGPHALKISPAGRLEFADETKGFDPIWVLWVDEDFRTAVIGSPSGSFGMILNRTLDIRDDRRKAARDILEFNGYDMKQILPLLFD